MYSLYVSKSVLVVSFDLASSNRESVIQYAMGLKVLHVVQRNLHNHTEARRAQQHLYMGVMVGISAKYKTGSTPSSGEKSNSFTGQGYSLCKEKTHLSLFADFVFPLP